MKFIILFILYIFYFSSISFGSTCSIEGMSQREVNSSKYPIIFSSYATGIIDYQDLFSPSRVQLNMLLDINRDISPNLLSYSIKDIIYSREELQNGLYEYGGMASDATQDEESSSNISIIGDYSSGNNDFINFNIELLTLQTENPISRYNIRRSFIQRINNYPILCSNFSGECVVSGEDILSYINIMFIYIETKTGESYRFIAGHFYPSLIQEVLSGSNISLDFYNGDLYYRSTLSVEYVTSSFTNKYDKYFLPQVFECI